MLINPDRVSDLSVYQDDLVLQMTSPDHILPIISLADQNIKALTTQLEVRTNDIVHCLRNAGMDQFAIGRDDFCLTGLDPMRGQRLIEQLINRVEVSTPAPNKKVQDLVKDLSMIGRVYGAIGFWQELRFDAVTYGPMLSTDQADWAKRRITEKYGQMETVYRGPTSSMTSVGQKDGSTVTVSKLEPIPAG